MILAGCDIGSLTAKAVILDDEKIIARDIIGVRATALKSAEEVMNSALKQAGLSIEDIDYCCSTGYGRFEIPFSNDNLSEISCHGMGAFWLNNSIKTVIDIGGQDCKVVALDKNGMIEDFAMNDKCAAGTGRSLEILSETIGLDLEQLGQISLESSKKIEISNKCSIFMELEVLQHLYSEHNISDIARAINQAVARRVAQLTRSIDIRKDICLTGGVSKNEGVVKILEEILDIEFVELPEDPQLIGAIGAAIYARQKVQPQVKN